MTQWTGDKYTHVSVFYLLPLYTPRLIKFLNKPALLVHKLAFWYSEVLFALLHHGAQAQTNVGELLGLSPGEHVVHLKLVAYQMAIKVLKALSHFCRTLLLESRLLW